MDVRLALKELKLKDPKDPASDPRWFEGFNFEWPFGLANLFNAVLFVVLVLDKVIT